MAELKEINFPKSEEVVKAEEEFENFLNDHFTVNERKEYDRLKKNKEKAFSNEFKETMAKVDAVVLGYSLSDEEQVEFLEKVKKEVNEADLGISIDYISKIFRFEE
jgi:hypothetical protein